jgi:formiminoglutamase
VRRNRGRVGSAAGPAALRDALASLSAGADLAVVDFGDAGVTGTDLESGQQVLGDAVSGALDSGHLPIVLGGGHETAFGSYLGLRASAGMTNTRLGIVNLDAHFDLRSDTEPSSGTPFRQIAEAEATAGHDFTYRVIGVSEPNNTLDLFETAAELGVAYLLDEECGPENLEHVSAFVADLIEDVDAIYLTIDLDVLPAYVAPGVSAPAAHGVPFDVILSVCKQLARSPKLAHVDVVELNPGFDIDNRTARAAARLIHTIAAEHTTVRRKHRADSDSSTRSSN